jgi:dipeptidase
MVALGNSTKSKKIIFAKNSDRPINEAQPLIIHQASDHAEGTMLKCTYISIPQVSHTYRVLGSQPYWLWGFEHGMNEHNVVIGNEAVWSKEPEEQKPGLLGMDLLRLGLERGKTAYEALKVITSLLEQYGQGGNAAINMEHRYHNSFLIADPNEAWIIETVGRRWVARRVEDIAGISNCYSTENHWDEGSQDIKEYAYQQGWASPDVEFNFAKTYTAMTVKHRNAYPRLKRLNKLLKHHKGNIDHSTMKAILRDHFEGEIIEPRWSPADGLFVSICMHCLDVNSSKTAAGTVVEIEKDKLSTWWSALSNPCCSVFAPFYINGTLPKNISCAGATFSEDSLWWKAEQLIFAIEENYPKYSLLVRDRQRKLEEELAKQTIPENPTQVMQENVNHIEALIDTLYSEIKQDSLQTTEFQQIIHLAEAKKIAGIKE